MFYDLDPASVGAPDGLTLTTYMTILEFFERYMHKDLIVMGMEPGGQAGGYKWPGMTVSK